MEKDSSVSSPTFASFPCFITATLKECEVVSCGFYLHFLNDMEHLFMHLLANYITPWEKCLLKSFAHFWTGFVCVFVCVCSVEL